MPLHFYPLFLLLLVQQLLASASVSASAAIADAATDNCTAIGEALCDADGQCAAFGTYGDQIQLHGCATTVPNADWAIFVRGAGGAYEQLPKGVNVDEDACAQHPRTGSAHPCAPPPPPPGPPHYAKAGAVELHTCENTVFFFLGRLYNVENIACNFPQHAGNWEPEVFGNHSYARIRDFETGAIIANITTSVGFGFVSAFVDYSGGDGTSDSDGAVADVGVGGALGAGTVWLFGTPADRCHGNGDATTVQAWWSTDLVAWASAQAFDLGLHTYNVQVTRTAPLGGASPAEREAWRRRRAAGTARLLPPHRYVMILECFHFAVNDNADGNLTHGWTLLAGAVAPPGAPCGGPSITYSPLDDFFYVLTGGSEVWLERTQDFASWELSSPSPFIAPSAGDGLASAMQGFSAAATTRGSPPARAVGVPENFPFVPFEPVWRENWDSWAQNSNDADSCCMHSAVNSSIVIWGASTQGGPPAPPLDGTGASSNSIGVAPVPLTQLLASYFA